MTEGHDYRELRRLVLRYGRDRIIKMVHQIACHEPQTPEQINQTHRVVEAMGALLAELERRNGEAAVGILYRPKK